MAKPPGSLLKPLTGAAHRDVAKNTAKQSTSLGLSFTNKIPVTNHFKFVNHSTHE
jgi:hypothetical protein